MNVLYLTPEGFNTPNPNNQMIMVLTRELLAFGNTVHIIQSRKTNCFPDIPKMLEGKENLIIETIARKNIDKGSFIKRYLNEVKWAFQSYRKCRKARKKTDVVVVQSCPTAVYELLLLKLFFRKPIVFNVYDLWPGNLLETGITNNKLVVWMLGMIQKLAYLCCKRIIVLSEDMEEKLIKCKVNERKISVVSAWYDDKTMKEVERSNNLFLKKYPQNDNVFTVQFAGSIGYVFNYEVVLKTALLLKEHKDIVFQIIGDGLFKNQFINEAKEKGLENIVFYPLQPVELVPDVYSACDIEIIPLRKAVIGVGVPSKAPLVMACGRVIVNSLEDSPYFRLFGDNNIGVSVPYDDAKSLANAIMYLKDNPEVYQAMSLNAKMFAFNNYSSSICTKKFNDILINSCATSK